MSNNTNKKASASKVMYVNKLRILALLCVMAIVTAIAILAHDGYEEGGRVSGYGLTYQHGYIHNHGGYELVQVYNNLSGEYAAGPVYDSGSGYVGGSSHLFSGYGYQYPEMPYNHSGAYQQSGYDYSEGETLYGSEGHAPNYDGGYAGIAPLIAIPPGYISNSDGMAVGVPVPFNPFVLDSITFTGFGAPGLPAQHATTVWPDEFAGASTATTPGGRTTIRPGFHGMAWDGHGGLWLTNHSARDIHNRAVLMRMCNTTGEFQMFRNWPTTTAHGLTTPIPIEAWTGNFSTLVVHGDYVWLIPEGINAVVRVNIHDGPDQQMWGFNDWSGAGFATATSALPNFRGGTIFTDSQGETYLVMSPHHHDVANDQIVYMNINTGQMSSITVYSYQPGVGRATYAIPDDTGGLWFEVRHHSIARLDLETRTVQYFLFSGVANSTGFPFEMGSLGNLIMRGGVYDAANGYIWMFPQSATHILRVTTRDDPTNEGGVGFIRAIRLPSGVPEAAIYASKFSGGGFDGRFVYMVPDNFTAGGVTHPPKIVRLDTHSPDLNNPIMDTFDLNQIAADSISRPNSGMYDYFPSLRPNFGVAFDGKNLWVAPFQADRVIRISQYLDVDMTLNWDHIGDVAPPNHNQRRIHNPNDARVRVNAVNSQRTPAGAVTGRIVSMEWVRVPLADTAPRNTDPLFTTAFNAAAADNRGTQAGPDSPGGTHSATAQYHITANRNANYWVRVTFLMGESAIEFTEIRHIVVDNIYTPIEVRHRGLREDSAPQVFLYTGALAIVADNGLPRPPSLANTTFGIPFDFGNPANVIPSARLGYDTIILTAQDHTATGWRLRTTGPNATTSPRNIILDRTTAQLITQDRLEAPVSPATHYYFTFIYYNSPDWARLNHAINVMSPPPATIIIHPQGTPGITEGVDPSNSTIFNLVVTDPGNGSTITTIPISIPAPAPADNPHRISVTRQVTVMAAQGGNIYFRMPIPGGMPNQTPWITTLDNSGRHFMIGTGGNMILGDASSGNLILDGNYVAAVNGAIRGGIAVTDSGQLTMRTGSTIMNGRALHGGGVAIQGESTFNMYGTAIIRNNEVTSRGAGVLVDNESEFNMSGYARIHDNDSNAHGGGVYMLRESEFHMSGNARIHDNTATNGGGVRVHTGSGFYMSENARIHDNTAWNDGGGININTFSSFTMTDNARIHGNTAARYGGGIDTNSDASVAISGNARVDDNRSPRGGGISVRARASLTMSEDVRIDNNHAVNYGGGVYVFGNNSVFTMHGGTIGGSRGCEPNCQDHVNQADCDPDQGNTATNGGGVWVGNGASFTMQPPPAAAVSGGVSPLGSVTSGIIAGNTALNGGGVHISATATALMANGVIRRNRAIVEGPAAPSNQTGTGGGVFLTGTNTTFTMNGGQIYENISNTITQGRGGGGVEAVNNAVFTLDQTSDAIPTEIFHNYALSSGGGVNIHGTTMHMHGGRVSRNGTNNAAEHGNGGGIALNANAIIHVHGGIIEDNAGRIGGGLFIYTSTAFMHQGTIIRGNASTHSGGGVAVFSGLGSELNVAHLRMYGGLIDDNGVQHHPIASVNAQGLPVPNLPGTGTLINTPQGGGVVTGRITGTFEMRGGTISNNWATYGGGIALILGSNATINPMGGGQPLIYNNTAALDGGGVHISGFESRPAPAVDQANLIASFFVMNGGTIDNNTATRNGGGIFIANDTVTATVGNLPIIRRNQATINAGVSIIGNTANAIGSATINGGGGGIYVAENGRLTATNTTITGNEAPYGMGGGIFTEHHEYACPITHYLGAVGVLPADVAYSNLVLAGIVFNNNQSYRRYVPPRNAWDVITGTAFTQTSFPASPPPIHNHPLNNCDINFHNPGIPFDFHKTNYQIFNQSQWDFGNPAWVNSILLPGAHFSIYRYIGTSTPTTHPIAGNLYPAGNWVYVDTAISSGLIGLPISFPLFYDVYYQMMETVPPIGFQVPFGHWQIRYGAGGFNITVVGDTAPIIHYIPCNCNSNDCEGGRRFVGNVRDFNLPLTGGAGIVSFVTGGSVVLGAAFVAVWFIVINKAKAKKAAA